MTTTEVDPAETTQVQEWTYTGRRVSSQDKTLYAWRTPDGQMLYRKQIVPGAAIGGVYAITRLPADGSIYVKGPDAPRFVRRAELDPELRAEWLARDAEAAIERDRASAIAKASQTHPLEDIVEPLRLAAAGMTPGQRRALFCEILRALRL